MANNKRTVQDLAESMAKRHRYSKVKSESFIRGALSIIKGALEKENYVKVKGLGTFKVLQMEDRESVNVNTGERFIIEGHQKISFSPDPELKDRINKPFSAFETVEITAEQAEEISKAGSQSESTSDSDESDKTDLNPVAIEPEKTDEKENDNEKEAVEKKSPEVYDVTQKKSVRVLLKILVWLLSISLAIVLGVYLLWPVLGNTILGIVERDITDSRKTEVVADSTGSAVAPVRETSPVKPAEPVSKPAEPVTKPAEPAVESAGKPETSPQKPQTPAGNAAAKDETPVNPYRFQLNKADEAKDLSEFTAADTVNYTMDGDMTVHVLQSGETITVLALKYYGSKKLWPYIVKYNNISNANSLRPGAKIRIPVLRTK